MWKTAETVSVEEVIERGPLRLSVGPSYQNPSQQAQYLCLNLCVLTSAPKEQCLETWPTEAIRLAREALDRLEAELGEGTCRKCGSPLGDGFCSDISCPYSDRPQTAEPYDD